MGAESSIESASVLMHRAGEEPADAVKAYAGFPIFDISGRRFVAVPARYCKAGETRWTGRRDSAVGRIVLGGELHLLFGRTRGNSATPAEVLTRRELQIAMLVADGKCDKQIARVLGISGYTVREHLRRTFSKLHVPNRSALVALVVRRESEKA